MRTSRTAAGIVALIAVLGIGLSACATPRPSDAGAPSSGSADSPSPAAPTLDTAEPALPSGEVTATGFVMDEGGDVSLCLGAIAESYPPQCSGIPVEGWSWDGLDGADSQGDKTWGDYTVTGIYDGESFTVTAAPTVPTGDTDDSATRAPGETDADELQQIISDVRGSIDANVLLSVARDGYAWFMVVWDDGTLQAAADAEYGPDVVVIDSVFQPVSSGTAD